jgi:hypothetical protein
MCCLSLIFSGLQHVLEGPFQIWNFYAYAEHGHDLYAQDTHQFMMRMLSESEGMFLTRMLRAAVPDAYAQHVLKGLWSVHALVPAT